MRLTLKQQALAAEHANTKTSALQAALNENDKQIAFQLDHNALLLKREAQLRKNNKELQMEVDIVRIQYERLDARKMLTAGHLPHMERGIREITTLEVCKVFAEFF